MIKGSATRRGLICQICHTETHSKNCNMPHRNVLSAPTLVDCTFDMGVHDPAFPFCSGHGSRHLRRTSTVRRIMTRTRRLPHKRRSTPSTENGRVSARLPIAPAVLQLPYVNKTACKLTAHIPGG